MSTSEAKATELFAKLLGFTSAYPEDMFPPLTKAEIAELPRGILDRASAAMGRHVAKFVQEAADAVEAQHREIERLERERAELSGIAATRNRNIALIAEERDRLRETLRQVADALEENGRGAFASTVAAIRTILRPAGDVPARLIYGYCPCGNNEPHERTPKCDV